MPNQSTIVQYNHELDLQKDLIENSVDNAVPNENLFHMVKHANMTMVGYCEHNQTSVLEETSFQEYYVKIFGDGFQDFYFVLQHVDLSKEHAKILESFEYSTERNKLQIQGLGLQFLYM